MPRIIARNRPPPVRPRQGRAAAIVRHRQPRRWYWRLLNALFMTAVWGALALGLVVLVFAWDLPRPEDALAATRRPSLALEDRTGHVFARFGDIVGEPQHLGNLPIWLPEAAVSVEDRRFYHHFGVDPVGMLRALWVDARAGHVVQGGSTITQQVAKNLFLSNTRSLKRKVQELLLTLWLEHTFTKKQILEIWLNRVYLGSGAWGVDAAAKLYFGIPASKLSLWQSAVIAGLPRAPSRFNPRTNPRAAAARGREVLAAMVEAGAITAAQAQDAGAHIAFPKQNTLSPGWFGDWVVDDATSIVPQSEDATLRTTLDPHLQAIAEQKLSQTLDGLGQALDAGEGAVVALDAASGAVRAMVGGHDYQDSPFNRAVLARRQPGSAFKPFVWLTALEDGATPSDTILDAPIRVGNWSPVNFERDYRGEITLEDALAHSVNTVSVRLLLAHGGARAVAETAHRLGLQSPLAANPSLALGTSEVGLLELAGAYAAFFNGGQRVTPYGIESMTLHGRQAPAEHKHPEPVIDPDVAEEMQQMLQAVVNRGSGHDAALPGHAIGGKTGTTQDYRDAWFIGCVDGLIIGVWIGNDDDTPMRGVVGGGIPARVFHEIAAAR